MQIAEIATWLACLGAFGWAWRIYCVCEDKLRRKVDIDMCKTIHANIDKRFEDLKSHINDRFNAIDKRLDDLHEILMKK
jgi:hypothetical protein